MKILHVEDDSRTSSMIAEMLEYRIKGNGKNCEVVRIDKYDELVEKSSDEWDLVICDGQIPWWNTHFEDVLRMVKCQIVVYSGMDRSALKKFTDMGAKEVFLKNPSDTKNLCEYICLLNKEERA